MEVKLGEVYWLPRVVYDTSDAKPGRPAVVLRAPTPGQPYAEIVTRTSATEDDGVFHPCDHALGLEDDGVWQWPRRFYRRVPHRRFNEADGVKRLGILGEPWLGELLARRWRLGMRR